MSNDLVALEVRALVDRQAILDCLNRYARGIDRHDRELLLSAYHPDAWDDHAVFCGPAAEFVDWALDYHAKFQRLHHHFILNHSCELDGDSAHSETYYLFAGVNREGPETILSGGRYIDRFEKRDGRWAIAARRCLIEWSGFLGDVPFAAAHLDALRSGGTSSRTPDDTSYDRPLNVTRGRELFPY